MLILGRRRPFRSEPQPTSPAREAAGSKSERRPLSNRNRGRLQIAKCGRLQWNLQSPVAINRFLKETDDDPKPFVWTADPDKIIAAVKRGYQTSYVDIG
jgi:hypothetical protein